MNKKLKKLIKIKYNNQRIQSYYKINKYRMKIDKVFSNNNYNNQMN